MLSYRQYPRERQALFMKRKRAVMLASIALTAVFFVWLYHHNQYELSFPMWMEAEEADLARGATAEVTGIEYDWQDPDDEDAEKEDRVTVHVELDSSFSWDGVDSQQWNVDMLHEDGWVTVYRPGGYLQADDTFQNRMVRTYAIVLPAPPYDYDPHFTLPKGVLREGKRYRLNWAGCAYAYFET